MSTEKLAEKIPDIYFDWYARLIPGVIALSYFFYMKPENFKAEGVYIAIYIAIAYLLGHSIQPMSSFLVEYLQKIVNSDEDRYAKAKQNSEYSSITAKVSKAYSEAVSMLSTFLLLLVVYLYTKYGDLVWFFFFPYLITATLERVSSRKRKILDLPD